AGCLLAPIGGAPALGAVGPAVVGPVAAAGTTARIGAVTAADAGSVAATERPARVALGGATRPARTRTGHITVIAVGIATPAFVLIHVPTAIGAGAPALPSIACVVIEAALVAPLLALSLEPIHAPPSFSVLVAEPRAHL